MSVLLSSCTGSASQRGEQVEGTDRVGSALAKQVAGSIAVVTHKSSQSSQDNQWVLSLAACPSLSVCSFFCLQLKGASERFGLGSLGPCVTTLAIPLTQTHTHTHT